jgi:hypothetical protein
MDWSKFAQQISIFIGIWVGIYGIDSWRREHVGKRKIELAEDSLALFYEAVDAIRHIRGSMSFDYETKDIEKMENEPEKAYEARKKASVVFVRYNQHQELFNKLHAMRYRFMSQIGKEQAKPFEDLRCITNEIILAGRMLARLWAREHFRTDEQWDQHQEQVDKYETIFWDHMSEDDPINHKMNKVIAEVESTCRQVIEAKNSLYGLLNVPLRIKFWKNGKHSTGPVYAGQWLRAEQGKRQQ